MSTTKEFEDLFEALDANIAASEQKLNAIRSQFSSLGRILRADPSKLGETSSRKILARIVQELETSFSEVKTIKVSVSQITGSIGKMEKNVRLRDAGKLVGTPPFC